jgi:hypothetical protein
MLYHLPCFPLWLEVNMDHSRPCVIASSAPFGCWLTLFMIVSLHVSLIWRLVGTFWRPMCVDFSLLVLYSWTTASLVYWIPVTTVWACRASLGPPCLLSAPDMLSSQHGGATTGPSLFSFSQDYCAVQMSNVWKSSLCTFVCLFNFFGCFRWEAKFFCLKWKCPSCIF